MPCDNTARLLNAASVMLMMIELGLGVFNLPKSAI